MDGIRSIVVHMDATPRAEARLRIGQALAREARAQLTALYAVTPTAYDMPLAVPEGVAVMEPALESIDRKRYERAYAMFERVVGYGGTPPAVWVDSGRVPTYTAFAAQALTADLLVFGQHDATEPQTAMEADLIASTLIESGTPALVVPHSGRFEPQALVRRDLTVLLAWKPTREAARAVHAALPWLQRAGQVHVAVESTTGNGSPWPGAAAVRAWLLLHGVQAEMRDHAVGHANTGEMLLSMAADISADLLVMGCFGHSRARELVMGGASRTVLRSMTLPTLMAH
jgi:nucleotide-binding universal stress UspA family protein